MILDRELTEQEKTVLRSNVIQFITNRLELNITGYNTYITAGICACIVLNTASSKDAIFLTQCINKFAEDHPELLYKKTHDLGCYWWYKNLSGNKRRLKFWKAFVEHVNKQLDVKVS